MANTLTVAQGKAQADAALTELKTQLESYNTKINEIIAQSNYIFPTLDLNANTVDNADIIGRVDRIPTPSDYGFGSFTLALPEVPTLNTISVPNFGTIPELSVTTPVLSLPTAPSAALPSAPGAAPGFNSPTVPGTPVLSLPSVPSFSNIAIPPVPTHTVPVYNVVFPDDDLLAPTYTFNYTEQQYQDDLLDELKLKLMDNLVNGGYGIEPLDEQPLWERAREREMLAAETAIEQAMANVAARGFMIPPGAAQALIEGAQQAALEKISSFSRDVALKRADLYVDNRKFTITEVREVEQMLITYFGYMQERALNVAKYTLEAARHTYDALVVRYQARVEAAKAAASTYEVQLRAGLAHLEAYKVEMEGAKLEADVQHLVADVYRTQLEGVKTYVDIYRTQMEGAKVAAEIEKLKLDAFRATVDVYSAQVSAKSAEFGMYKARIDGEMSKVDIYRAQVGAYGEQVQAFTAIANTKRTALESEVAVARLELDSYKYELEGYHTRMEVAKIELDALLGKHQSDTARYTARVQAQAAVAASSATVSKANADILLAKAKTAGDYATSTAQQLTSRATLSGSSAVSMFKAYSGIATATAAQNAGLSAEITST